MTKAERDAKAQTLIAQARALAGESDEPEAEVAAQPDAEVVLAPVADAAADVAEMDLTEDQAAGPAFEPPPEASPEPQTDYDRFLLSLPPEALELLDPEELQDAFDRAQQEAREERRRQLKTAAAKKAKMAARASAGLLTPEEVEAQTLTEKNEKQVKVTIQLPFVGDTGGVASDGVTIDGTKYVHGASYVMPMARALTIRSILYNLHQHELDFEGKGRLSGLRRQQASGVNIVDLRRVA